MHFVERLSMENIHAPEEYPALLMGNLVAYNREILGVIGLENSGHSTFLEILAGEKKLKRGTIWINGELCRVDNHIVDTWWRRKIWTLYYHTELLPCFNVAEYFMCPVMDFEKNRLIHENAAVEHTTLCFQRAGVNMNPRAKINTLSSFEQHIVFLLRAKEKGAQIIIIDDLASLYTPNEIQLLGKLLHYLADEGITIICKFNNLSSLIDYVDRLVVFRNGCSVKELSKENISRTEIYRYMLKEPYIPYGTKKYEKKNLEKSYLEHGCAAANNLFNIRRGEIVLTRTGDQGETSQLVTQILDGYAEMQRQKQFKFLEGKKGGIKFLPKMASRQCIIENMSISDNLCISNFQNVSFCSLVKDRVLRYLEDLFKKDYGISTKVKKVCDLDEISRYALLFRRIAISKAEFLLVEDPWTCNDEQVCRFIIEEMRKAADRGMAVLVVTNSQLDFGTWSDREIIYAKYNEGSLKA